MRDRAAVWFGLINLALLPWTLLGYGTWLGTLVLRRRGGGASATAQGALFDRWLRHHLGVRQDSAAARLLPALPGLPRPALYLAAGPMLLAHRLTGYVPVACRGGRGPGGWKASRLLLFDAALERHRASVQQVVSLGAGFQTRAPGPPHLPTYEVDLPEVNALKRQALRRAGLGRGNGTLVDADLADPGWMDHLARAGFRPGRTTFFLWEGVTMYLERATVEAVLRRLAGAAPGSLVAFDYATPAAVDSRARFMRWARALARAVGEPLRSGLDRPGPLLSSCGLHLLEHVPLGPWGGFAVATMPARE